MENEPTVEKTPEKGKALKVVKLILKICLGLIILAVIAVSVSRIIVLDTYPNEVTRYIWTDRASDAYKKDPDGFRVFDIYVGQNYSNLGLFFNAYIRLTDCPGEKLSEFQLTVRYNDSTVKQLNKTDPIEDDDPFVFVLCNDKGDAYIPSSVKEASKSNLNYRRLVFEDVDMVDVDYLYINIYSKSEVDYSGAVDFVKARGVKGADEKAFSYMPVYSSKNVNEEYRLGSDELP